MVGGLIQEQDIRPTQSQDSQCQPASLSTAQSRDLFEHILTMEKVQRQVTASLLRIHFPCREQFIQHGIFRIKLIMCLGKVADIQASAQLHLTL